VIFPDAWIGEREKLKVALTWSIRELGISRLCVNPSNIARITTNDAKFAVTYLLLKLVSVKYVDTHFERLEQSNQMMQVEIYQSLVKNLRKPIIRKGMHMKT
jgi:hypothetical protein